MQIFEFAILRPLGQILCHEIFQHHYAESIGGRIAPYRIASFYSS